MYLAVADGNSTQHVKVSQHQHEKRWNRIQDTTASGLDITNGFRNISKVLLSFTTTATMGLKILLGNATKRCGS